MDSAGDFIETFGEIMDLYQSGDLNDWEAEIKLMQIGCTQQGAGIHLDRWAEVRQANQRSCNGKPHS
jgi:hypothetical protein